MGALAALRLQHLGGGGGIVLSCHSCMCIVYVHDVVSMVAEACLGGLSMNFYPFCILGHT